ncbi:BA75_04483T0 [Komagataella pastoris]|uniref:BA75_04483T0 n=1 Tax=Komagataella pastoris TaxID=4922 RepID=A0A1B2JI96_PICPA|nr:BA75_04483T0 [Komagataella pastoris]
MIPLDKEFELNNQRVLTKRKIEYRANFVTLVDIVCYVVLLTIYFKDNSFLRLLVRTIVQVAISNPFPIDIPLSGRTMPFKRMYSKKLLQVVEFSNLLCLAAHLFMAPTHTQSHTSGLERYLDTYNYGGIAVHLIGEKYIDNWFVERVFLLLNDLMLFGLQFLLFYVTCCVNQNVLPEEGDEECTEPSENVDEILESNERVDNPIQDITETDTPILLGEELEQDIEDSKEYDGYTGNIKLFDCDPLHTISTIRKFNRHNVGDIEEGEGDGTLGEMPGSFEMITGNRLHNIV